MQTNRESQHLPIFRYRQPGLYTVPFTKTLNYGDNDSIEMKQVGAADSAMPIRRGQLGVGTIRSRLNSTQAIRRGDISAHRQ